MDTGGVGRVATAFGVDGVVEALPGERTLNARVTGAGGRRVVVKVHVPDDADDVNLETAALDHLAGTPAARLVPSALRTADGAVRVDAAAGRFGRVLTWLDGTTWADGAPDGDRTAALRSLGAAVARVDAALAGFTHPHLARSHRWNLMTAGDRLAQTRAITDDALRATVEQVLTGFVADALPRLRALPQQAVHNDANDANVVLGADGTVTGLVDFGDLCLAPRVCGLGVALAYAMADAFSRNDSGDPWRAVLPLVEGYHAQAPLDPDEVALLQPLVRARLATSVVMAAVQHAADPSNEYLLVSQKSVRALLERLTRNGSGDDPLTTYRLREAGGLVPAPHARAARA